MLRERGVERVEVVGDPAIVYARDAITPKAQARRIGLNLNDRSYFFGNANQRVVPLAVEIIRRLRETGWTVTLYPMGPEDRDVTERVLGECGDGEIAVERWDRPLLGHFDAIAQQDVFVGVRLHSTAAAVCTYTPAVMLAYQPKNVEFMETLGLGDHCLRIDRIEGPEELVALIERLHDTAPGVQERQQAACATFRERLFDLRDRIHALAG
jgi:polysaccharide pyruvyl transferase WcaK-like protein